MTETEAETILTYHDMALQAACRAVASRGARDERVRVRAEALAHHWDNKLRAYIIKVTRR